MLISNRSWQTSYVGLSQFEEEADNGTLKRFFTDPQTIDYLVSVFSPYNTPNPQTRSTFDTKTSAINVAPSTRAHYDITQIKADALWLSQKTTIDEVAALRITVLGWQMRSTTRLLQSEILEQSTIPLQLSVQTDRSLTLHDSIRRASHLPGAQDPTNARRLRLLEIYLSERHYLLKNTEYILSRLVCRAGLQSDQSPARRQDSDQDWLCEIGEAILSAWKVNSIQDGRSKKKGFIATAVDALRSRLQGITSGCPWFESETVPETTQVAWAHNQWLEIIHILQIAMSLLEMHKEVLPSGPLLSWFRLMNEVSFFEDLHQPVEHLQRLYDLPLKSVVVLVSLALVNISATLELVAHTSTSLVPSADPTDASPYVHSPITVNELNDIFISLAPLRVASPVILAWSIITQTIREMALSTRESKETRQSLRAADRYGAMDSSDTDGAEKYSLRSVSSLRRRSSTGSDTSLQSLLVEDLYDAITVTAVEGDPISYLAMNAVHDDNVFNVVSTIASDYCTSFGFEHAGRPGQKIRNRLLELLRSCVDFIQYQPALIDTTMAILTGKDRFWDLLDRPAFAQDDQPSTLFIRDQAFRQKLLLVAASRFPYESVPFLEFCRALAFTYTRSDGSESAPWANLEELDTFTCRLPSGFEATSPIREEEEGDFVRLTDTLTVLVGSVEADLLSQANLPQRSSRASSRFDSTIARVAIPAGTTGVIQSETKPFVIGWNYQYPGLTYMGRILQRASVTGSSVGSSIAFVSPIVVAEVIRLINVLLVSAMKSPWAERDPSLVLDSANSILCQASDGLDRNQDVVSVIFEIFDNELHHPQREFPGDTSLDVLAQCMQFTNALLLLMPDRVWPFLGRSGLLKLDQEEDQLSWIISQEMVAGQYEFLLGCVRLYEALIEDAVSHGVSRKGPMKAIARFGSADPLGSGVSQITMQSVLLSFTRSMIDVMESTISWRFVVPTQRMEINQRLCSAFEKILTYCYGVNDNPDISLKLTSPLATAAKHTFDAFLSTSNNDFIVKPLLEIFCTTIGTRTTTLPTIKEKYQVKQTAAALDLVSTLLRINTALHQPRSYMEGELFKATPILTKIYAVQESYRLPVVKVFNALLASSATGNVQPPSLLGYLGHDGANNFLEVLSQLDKPINNATLSIEIWNLFSAVVSKRQQWFAMYVLTGSTPRESLMEKKELSGTSPDNEETILNIALTNLSSVDKLDPSKALAMLEFVAMSAEYWPWVFTTMSHHPDFLKAISEYLARIGLTANVTNSRSRNSSPDYNSLQMASYITKILAMHTHYAQQLDDQKTARSLVPHLNYLVKNAISVPIYNNSLHGNLSSNLDAKFSGCSLVDFKRTQWRRAVLGESYFYDVDFASKVFSHDRAWVGRKGQGFMEEFKRANTNLSLVEAQIVSPIACSHISANAKND